ncbi:glycosyltransferase family 2 protein [Embleya sp. NPDC059237]|uniref:glycosyltransferase family 2 protein n=1 Tax=Embleya sp. NPDC059237 TaxID=3346784 RepID=UPI0036CE2E0D
MTGPTLETALKAVPNAHAHIRAAFTARTAHPWHAPTPARLAEGTFVSVVVPVRDTAYALPHTLDALAAQHTHGRVEVIVVDDASTDASPDIAAHHPVVDILVRLPRPVGSGAARNAGTRLAHADHLVYLDADMVLPSHVLADFAARSRPDTVLVGFRHNAPAPHDTPPATAPDLAADHRVTWRPPGGVPLIHSGLVMPHSFESHPLTDTRDFQDLGLGCFHYDWDLPRMVVTALLGVPRAAVEHVGGFEPAFGALGWGMEDTHLGAALIASGLTVVPLRQTVGHHLDPADAATQWKRKLESWPHTHALYRKLLDGPPPTGRAEHFRAAADELLGGAEVTSR